MTRTIILLALMVQAAWGQSAIVNKAHSEDECLLWKSPDFPDNLGIPPCPKKNGKKVKAARIPVVTDAVQEKVIEAITMNTCPPLPDGTHGKDGNECYIYPQPAKVNWTCSDPDSVLFESVNGKKHICVRF